MLFARYRTYKEEIGMGHRSGYSLLSQVGLSALSLAALACLATNHSLIAQEGNKIADLVIKQGDIRTMDTDKPTAKAIAIAGNQIVHVGDDASVQKWIGPATKVIDAQGRLVLPGFNDSHVHFLSGGEQLSSVQLRDAESPKVFADRIAKYSENLPAGDWILGGDWDHENWENPTLPHRDWIDASTSDRGLFVTRLDGHMGLANSYALKLAGIDEKTPDPAGGEIVREPETGRPTGILKDAAMNLVYKHVPASSVAAKRKAILDASNHAASLGVTSVQDMSARGLVSIYRELIQSGELKTRIYAVTPLPRWEEAAASNYTAALGDDWLRVGGLKGFSDGSLGSTTALFFAPYADAPRTVGLPADEMFPEGAMLDRVRGAVKAGLHVMIHAIGDAANDQILTIFETVAKEQGSANRRFRIEHAQHIRPQDIPRFHSSKTIASMQPYHCADDGRWAEKRIGKERLKGTYAFRSLLEANVVLAFGSDWSVAPLDPLVALEAAVTRRTLDGKNPDGWIPEEKITIEQAVYAYTVGSAYAEFTDKRKGKLKEGMLADLVIVSENLFDEGFDRWKEAKIDVTVVDGKIVYER